MEETHQQGTTSSRLGMRGGGGEIVEVQGGHIVRSTGRKDRHSKVCTAKGPRDRRVRLSAHTAIQFYDVQDRLGYDRPSKAVDWLIKKAKAAIDKLAELPAWNPNTCAFNSSGQQQNQQLQEQQMKENDDSVGVHGAPVDAFASSSCRTTSLVESAGGGRISEPSVRNVQQQLGENPHNSSSFLPPSLATDIADTIKSFFPMGAVSETTSTSIQFQNYPPDLLSRTSSHNQDLRLSLQSFQDPILQLQQAQHRHQTQNHHQNEQVLFSATTPLGFDGTSSSGWSEQYQSEENGRFQRMVAWNAGADTGNSGQAAAVGGGGGGGFIFSSLPPTATPTPLPSLFGQSQYLSQRGPLQSSNTPSIRAWIDPSITPAAVADHHHHYPPPTIHHHPSSLSGFGFTTSSGFSGFRIPARIRGEEEHDGVSDKPSSASSDSRH